MTRTIFYALTLGALAHGPAAFAQQAPDPDVGGVAGAAALLELVVTATRSPQAIERVGSSVVVIDAQAIKASQAVAAIDLLAQTPSVSFTRNGGVGAATSVNIRGSETQHVVVLIDGVKLNDPSSTQGGFNFGNLLIGDVSRIEVLRGAQGTLWGSQAVGGVVNIVTAEPTGPLEGSVNVEGGSRGTALVRAGVGGASDRVSWRLAGEQFTTDGFSAYAAGKEDDGYQNSGLSGRVRVTLSDQASVEARSVWSRGRNQFDAVGADSPEFSRTEELVAYVGLNLALLDGRLKNRLAYAYTDTDRENLNPGRPTAPLTLDASGRNKRFEYQGTFAISERWDATFGAETERSTMRTRSPTLTAPNPAFRRGKAGVDSGYAQVQGQVLSGLTLTGGLRRDRHDVYGGKTLGQLAAAWALNGGGTVLRASFGQGFRAPSLYELYSEFGATGLEPESFDSWDAGVEQRLLDGAVTMSATWFHRDADNEIRFNGCTTASTDPLCRPAGVLRSGYYRNILKTRAQGVELVGRARLGGRLSMDANYTWTDAKIGSGANAGNRLPRRPKNMGNLTASYAWPSGLSTGVAIHYVGGSFNTDANTTGLKGYTTLDLRASWPVNARLEVYGRIENLLDRNYQTILNYGTAGRGGFVGLRARF